MTLCQNEAEVKCQMDIDSHMKFGGQFPWTFLVLPHCGRGLCQLLLYMTDTFEDQLYQWITGNVSQCEHSLFIFDEVDKMQPGIMDAIRPFIDHYPKINRINFRKSIFIFLSNAGGNEITNKTLQHWKKGKKREDITHLEMEEVLELSVFNQVPSLSECRHFVTSSDFR